MSGQPSPPRRGGQPDGQDQANSYYNPAVADPLDPITFVHKIKVPVFMACQWEDEQTGGHCADLAEHFTGTKQKWFTFTNGAHIDSLDPYTYDRWYDFLELFVAQQAPIVDAAASQAAAPVIYQEAMGLRRRTRSRCPRTPSRRSRPTRRRSPPSRSFPRSGCCSTTAPAPRPQGPRPRATPTRDTRRTSRRSPSRERSPAAGTSARRHPRRPAADAQTVNSYTSNANALPRTDYGSNTGRGGLWGNASQWQWNWEQNPSGSAVSYSRPVDHGHDGHRRRRRLRLGAVVDARRRPPGDDQRGASGWQRDIRPEGWIRASERKLSTGSDNMFKQPSTLLEPIPELHEGRRRPLPAGRSSRCRSRSTSRGMPTGRARASA